MIKNALLAVTVSSFLLACATPPAVIAKPTAPVAIENSAPQHINAGDEFTSTITFTAETKLNNLVLSLSPDSGIELLSQNSHARFFDLQRNDTRALEITLRLIEPVGYLSVFATTIDPFGKRSTKTISLIFGDHKNVPTRGVNEKAAVSISNGEKLILMPGEARP